MPANQGGSDSDTEDGKLRIVSKGFGSKRLVGVQYIDSRGETIMTMWLPRGAALLLIRDVRSHLSS